MLVGCRQGILAAGAFAALAVGALIGSGGAWAAGGSTADAVAASDALEAAVKFTAPGPAFKAGDALAGKTVYAIVSGENAAFVQEFIKGLKDGAAVLGAKVEVQDSGYDPTKASELIDKGVALGAKVIVTQSVDSSAVAASLGGAKKAGIPVVEATSHDAAAPGADLEKLGVSAISSFCYTCAGKQMADYAVASTGGKVNALLYNVPGIVVSERMVKGFQDELARVCATCTVTVVDAPAANWETNLASLTTSNVQTHPNINILVPVFDAMVGLIEPAIASSGIKGVSIVTYNATAPALGLMAAGKLVTGDVGGSPYWLGWATMDQAARLASGGKPVDDVAVPHRLFDAKNVKELDLKAAQQSWYGSFDLPAQYKALWGK